MDKLTEDEKLTLNSYNNVASAWAKNHDTQNFWGKNLEVFHKLLPKGKILEIGCGSGRDAQDLISLGYDYIGTDVSVGQLTEARKNNPSGIFKEQSVYSLDFIDSFDGFWAAAVLIHVPKSRITEALQAIKKNMKKRALGFIAMKEGEGEKVEERPELDNSRFLFTYWDRGEFRSILKENNFISLHEDYIPMSERTKWLTYIVRSS